MAIDKTLIFEQTRRTLEGIAYRMLGTLAEALDREDGADDALPVTQTDGESLVNLRPAAGWSSWDQIRSVALGGSQAKLDALRPYLALSATLVGALTGLAARALTTHLETRRGGRHGHRN